MGEFFKHIYKNLFHKVLIDASHFATVGRRFRNMIRYIPEEDQILDEYVNYILYNNVVITDRVGDEISFSFSDGSIVFFSEHMPNQNFRGGVRSNVDSMYCMFGE